MYQNIYGKAVVITGASSGLGIATAKYLSAHGAKLVLGARRLDRIKALTLDLGLSEDAIIQTDATDHTQVKHLVDTAVAIYGRIDVLINNAGLMLRAMLELGKIADWDQMIDVKIKDVLSQLSSDVRIFLPAKLKCSILKTDLSIFTHCYSHLRVSRQNLEHF